MNESYPGLWEFPMWDVQDEAGTVLTNMDPQGDLYEAYSREFDRNYYGEAGGGGWGGWKWRRGVQEVGLGGGGEERKAGWQWIGGSGRWG